MWEHFFDALGTIFAWGLWFMLGVVMFVWAKFLVYGLWSIVQALL